MIINRKEKTCKLTPEDKKEIGDIDDYVVRPIVDSMIEDIRQDLERWVQDYKIKDDEKINPEGLFEMAYEMFESYYYSYIKQCVIEIVMKTKVI